MLTDEKKNNFTEKSGGEIKSPKESSANILVLILVTTICVILCILITLAGIFCCCKIFHLKNNNRNKTEKEEMIMLMPADENGNIVTIQINVFESYLEKTMLSTNNLENLFYVSGFT
jgi:heme/copper-type cytochrome/quinol oxidase subunit 2